MLIKQICLPSSARGSSVLTGLIQQHRHQVNKHVSAPQVQNVSTFDLPDGEIEGRGAISSHHPDHGRLGISNCHLSTSPLNMHSTQTASQGHAVHIKYIYPGQPIYFVRHVLYLASFVSHHCDTFGNKGGLRSCFIVPSESTLSN
jgi:hypothetical protein